MTTVCCVWVKGHVKFSPDYVTKLRNMVSRNLGSEFRFVCLTDRPELLPYEVTAIKIPKPTTKHGWWSKIELFNPAHHHGLGLSGRCLYLDLDVLVLNDLDPILHFPSNFAIAPTNAPTFKPLAYKTNKQYNSSVMVWNSGEYSDIFEKWNDGVAKKWWGDQDWIAELHPNLDMMPLPWFPRISELQLTRPHGDAKIVLCKKPKNDEAANKYPWVREIWS
jgi:hypothetical protein